MSDRTFELAVVTPERTVFEGRVRAMTLPTPRGLIGILPGHAPLVTAVDTGEVKVEDATGSTFLMLVTEGFFEVAGDSARLLSDVGEKADEIDLERARAAEKRARERLLAARRPDLDLARAEAAFRRAIARQKVVRDLERYRGR